MGANGEHVGEEDEVHFTSLDQPSINALKRAVKQARAEEVPCAVAAMSVYRNGEHLRPRHQLAVTDVGSQVLYRIILPAPLLVLPAAEGAPAAHGGGGGVAVTVAPVPGGSIGAGMGGAAAASAPGGSHRQATTAAKAVSAPVSTLSRTVAGGSVGAGATAPIFRPTNMQGGVLLALPARLSPSAPTPHRHPHPQPHPHQHQHQQPQQHLDSVEEEEEEELAAPSRHQPLPSLEEAVGEAVAGVRGQ